MSDGFRVAQGTGGVASPGRCPAVSSRPRAHPAPAPAGDRCSGVRPASRGSSRLEDTRPVARAPRRGPAAAHRRRLVDRPRTPGPSHPGAGSGRERSAPERRRGRRQNTRADKQRPPTWPGRCRGARLETGPAERRGGAYAPTVAARRPLGGRQGSPAPGRPARPSPEGAPKAGPRAAGRVMDASGPTWSDADWNPGASTRVQVNRGS